MSLIKNEFPLLSLSIMKGVMRHIKKCGFAYIKALPDRRSEYAIGHSIRRGQICLFGGTIEFFLSEKRKAAKQTGAFTQRIEEIGESYGDEHSS